MAKISPDYYTRRIIASLLLLLSAFTGKSQLNPITTAVPFLLISDNAQAGGIGEVNVVASPLYYHSASRNPALLARNEKVYGGSITYIPWLRSLGIHDMFIVPANFYYSLDSNNAIGYSGAYSNLGEINITSPGGTVIGTYRPNEYCHSFKYAHSFSTSFSAGVAAKYIYSNLTMGSVVAGTASKPASSWAGDAGVDYRKLIKLSDIYSLRTDVGFAVINMGPKISYDITNSRKDFLPTLAQTGVMFGLEQKASSQLSLNFDIAYQAEKLLVPTPPHYNSSGVIIAGKDPDVSAFKGMFQSFNDAPLGTGEELQEIIHKIGMESRLVIKENAVVAFRTGYFKEGALKGNRKYSTIGIGGGIYGFSFDAAYILTHNLSLLNNTLYFTLGFKSVL